MTKWEKIKQQEKTTRKELKNCEVAKRFKAFGFKEPLVNGCGECSGCYNPDDNELEQQCRECQCNEYSYA